MKKVFLFISILSFSAACKVKPDDSFIETWNIETLDTKNADIVSQRVYRNACLSFYPDGKLSFFQKFSDEVKTRSVYYTGTWREYGAGLELSVDSLNLHQKFEIRQVERDELVMAVTGDAVLNGTTFTCVSLDFYKNRKFDLLDPANNTWRKKPTRKESPAEIKTRVLNHVRYLIGYFEVIKGKKQNYFDTSPLQTPVRFQMHGLSLVTKFERGNKWRSCFFDWEDAWTGSKLLKQSVMSIKEYPVDEESLANGYHDALKLMAEHLEDKPLD